MNVRRKCQRGPSKSTVHSPYLCTLSFSPPPLLLCFFSSLPSSPFFHSDFVHCLFSSSSVPILQPSSATLPPLPLPLSPFFNPLLQPSLHCFYVHTHFMSATDNNITQRKEQQRKMSCNGCRVLRKGCSDSCSLRQSLQWIESPQSQAHATVFVAKFFGRAGLMTFIDAVPEPERPALFKSLLYEACGRTVNPVHGALGLLWTGKWQICQAAVQTILSGGSLDPTPASPWCPSTDADRDRNGMSANEKWPNETGLRNYPGDDDVCKIYELGACVESRRVRQRIDGNNNNNNIEITSAEADKLGQWDSGIDGKNNDIKLDLSLNCPSKSKSSNLKQQRVSSPSTNSVNSDGSVNRLKSCSPHPPSKIATEQKLLDLL